MSYKLESNGYELELTEGIPIPFNFSIADIVDISKRSRSFSKEIKLEFTARNRRFFAGNFGYSETENGISFDPTKRQPCTVSHNGIVTMPNGVMQLKKVVNRGGVIYGVVQVFSEVVDLYLKLSSYTLADLDWSAHEHILSIANIQATWSATAGSGYYYPLIDRGLPRPAPATFRTIDLIPYVYLKEVIEKSFALLGVSISSSFFSSSRFRNILIGYGGGEMQTITAIEINNRKVILSNVYTTNYQSVLKSPIDNAAVIFQNVSSTEFSITETQDIFNQHLGGEITVARSGNYLISISGVVKYLLSITNGLLNYSTLNRLRILKNGSSISEQNFGTQVTLDQDFTVNKSFSTYLSAGDVITFIFSTQYLYVIPDGSGNYVTCERTISFPTHLTVNMLSIDSQITDGSTVDLSLFLPAVKLSDLLSSVVKHFNLYISDPVNGVVTIEPLSNFYLPTDQFTDISETVDRGQDITIEPTGNNFPKTVNFKFKEGKDVEFTKYFDKYNERYGDIDMEQSSFFATGEKKMELVYSTIVPYQIPTTSLILPRFVKQNQNGTIQPNKGDLRIMMRNSLRTGSWVLQSEDGLSSSSFGSFPLVHHFDSVSSPNFDLNFQLPNELYYLATQATNINAFSEYSAEFINELISPAGKKITLQNKWSTKQINELNFAKMIMLDGALFRLNSISDFDTDSKITAKTELIKVLKAKKPNRNTVSYPLPYDNYYKSSFEVGQTFRASIFQKDTAVPTITDVSINTMGVGIKGIRIGVGDYQFKGFTNLNKKTIITYTNVLPLTSYVLIEVHDSTTLSVKTYNSSVLSDNVLPDPEGTLSDFILTVTN